MLWVFIYKDLWYYFDTRVSQKFCNILVVRACWRRLYLVTVIVGALTPPVWFESSTDVHTSSLIQKLVLYEFELGHKAVEATKNICCAKDDDAVDHYTVTRWVKKYRSGWNYLDNHVRSGKIKTEYFVLQNIEANPASCTRRVSGELSISQSRVVHHLHDLGNSIRSSWIVSRVLPKLLPYPSLSLYIYMCVCVWTIRKVSANNADGGKTLQIACSKEIRLLF